MKALLLIAFSFLLALPVGGDRQRDPGHVQEFTARRPAVLFIHGWGGNASTYEYLAGRFERLGYVTERMNLPGHGGQAGNIATLTRKEFVRAVVDAYDELAARPDVDPRRISGVGVSLGAYLIAVLAGERKLDWIELQAPALYPDEGYSTQPLHDLIVPDDSHDRLIAWRALDEAQAGSLALEALRRTVTRVLLIECERDELVPSRVIDAYYNASRLFARREILRGASHAGLSDEEQRETARYLLRWIALPLS